MAYDVLYISYDGILDPLGKSQVNPYIVRLTKKGIRFVLLSFEKKNMLSNRSKLNAAEEYLKEFNVLWFRLQYHKSPSVPATLFDIISGSLYSMWLIKRHKIKIVHARGYIAGIITMLLKKIYKIRFIFDIRGLWPDEKADAGLWERSGLIYRALKIIEKLLFKYSDEIVVLSNTGHDLINTIFKLNNKVSVIPTCADLELFKSRKIDMVSKIPIPNSERFILTYLGSVGSWYMLSCMVDFFKVIRSYFSNSLFMILHNGDNNDINSIFSKKSVDISDYIIKNLDYLDVAEYLNISDASVSFIKPVMSKVVSCPTKFGESLSCGIPVIINSGIGDTADIVKRERVGVVIDKFSDLEYRKAAEEFSRLIKEKDELRQRCRYVAEKYFSLDAGVEKYQKIYNKLLYT